MSRRMRTAVVAAGCAAVLGSSAGVSVAWQPARAETVNCASAMNSQGSRCFSPTFSTSDGVLSIATEPGLGSIANLQTYVFGGSSEQDFDNICVPGTGCSKTTLEVMPNGVEFSPTRCLQANSSLAGSTFFVSYCDPGGEPLQWFATPHQNTAGCAEYKLAGSGDPGLAITANPESETLTLETYRGLSDANQFICRTD